MALFFWRPAVVWRLRYAASLVLASFRDRSRAHATAGMLPAADNWLSSAVSDRRFSIRDMTDTTGLLGNDFRPYSNRQADSGRSRPRVSKLLVWCRKPSIGARATTALWVCSSTAMSLDPVRTMASTTDLMAAQAA